MSAARARKKGPLKGRSLVALGLVAFLAIASLVVWRRSVGIATAKVMARTNETKRALESERVTLERDIRTAKTRRQVIAEAERRLGFHVAADSQTRVIADPGRLP